MTHEQLREVVRRANPVRDPNSLVSASALIVDREEMMEMQTDDRPMVEEKGTGQGRGLLVGIAAAVLVLAGGAIFYLTTRDETPVAEPAPNAKQLPGDFESLEPGAYYADTDGDGSATTRGTFVIEGEGWVSLVAAGAHREGVSIDSGVYVALQVGELDQVWEAPCDGGASSFPGTTAQALGDQFAAMPGFTTREGLAPVTAFGRDGYHLVLEVPSGCSASETYNVWRSKNWGERYYQAEGQIVEFWFLDVEGTTVMVEATRPPESGEEIVTELNAALDSLLDTLVITP